MTQWTPERRSRQSQLIHQWKPWQKSTGAKTTEGKATSKMNAYKHGAYDANSKSLMKQIAGYKQALCDLTNLSM